jgi:hypothetical protein
MPDAHRKDSAKSLKSSIHPRCFLVAHYQSTEPVGFRFSDRFTLQIPCKVAPDFYQKFLA